MRKIIALSDWHITSGTPASRTDDYGEAQMRKVAQVVSWANHYQADIFCGGDLFDNNRVSYKTFSRLITELKKCETEIFVVRGNHDSYYHNEDLTGTPLGLLNDLGIVTLVEGWMSGGWFNVYGHGWGTEERVEAVVSDKVSIFLGHISVFYEKIPFYFEGKEAYTAKTLLEEFPGFDLYVCGDIHEPCVAYKVIVSGSMMRSTVAQKDYKPRAYLVTFISKGSNRKKMVEPLHFDIEKDVFVGDDRSQEEDGEFSLELKDLVDGMKKSLSNKFDFKETCYTLADQNEARIAALNEIFGSRSE